MNSDHENRLNRRLMLPLKLSLHFLVSLVLKTFKDANLKNTCNFEVTSWKTIHCPDEFVILQIIAKFQCLNFSKNNSQETKLKQSCHDYLLFIYAFFATRRWSGLSAEVQTSLSPACFPESQSIPRPVKMHNLFFQLDLPGKPPMEGTQEASW